MALGFQDCCNSASYFYLNGIPATVSEFETYYITTSQGENFCATYVDVPALNYLPPTYNLLEMTQFVDCDDCKTSNNYTCPTSETILSDQVSAGSVAVSDCRIVTIMPLYAECVSVDPTVANASNGSVSVFVTGGTPPYFFYSGGTTNAVGNNAAGNTNNVFPIFQNLPQGTYNVDVTDSNNDFLISLSCVLDTTPPDLTVSCVPTNVSINGANNGSISLNVTGGIPPYKYYYLGNLVTLPISNLVAGSYNIEVRDSGVGGNLQIENITCTVTEPDAIDFPQFICLKFTMCDTVFTLQLENSETYQNYRPIYVCNFPEVFGMASLSLFYGTNGWTTSSQSIITQPSFNGFCGISVINQTFSLISNQPTSSLPFGSYINTGSVIGLTGIIVTLGICQVSGIFVSAQEYCALTPNLLSSVVVNANGGTPPYNFNVFNNLVNQLSSSPTFSLRGGSYSLVVTDSLGTESNPSSFIVTTNPGTDVLFGIDACSTGNFTYSVTNQINQSPFIQLGESGNLIATVSTTIDFSFLPNGAQFTGKLKFSLDSIFISGGEAYAEPVTTNIKVTPQLNTNQIITNGVTTNILNGVIPQFVSQAFPSVNGTNGVWYNFAKGSQCCSNPTKEGLKWSQNEYWETPTLTFNNTTQLILNIGISTVNMVPFLKGKCASSFCGGYLQNTMKITLQNLNPVTGCLNLNGEKVLTSFTVENNSNGVAGWVTPPIFC
jgi:hypothetical protein